MDLRQWVTDLRHEWRSFGSAYPRFVTVDGAGIDSGEIPVFVFHTIEPPLFERQLQFLRENEYRTLSCTEFVDRITGTARAGAREVLLTIDDARSSTWRYAYPLLARYGFQATSFVIPAWTPDSGGVVRPTLTDVWNNKATADQVRAADPDDLMVCSWAELQIMSDSGVIDVQSHSYSHRRAFTPSPMRDCFKPGGRCAPFDLPYSPYLSPDTIFTDVRDADHFGLPLFATTSVLSGEPLWRLRADLRERCRVAYRDATAGGARGGARAKRAVQAIVPENSLELIPEQEVRKQIEQEVIQAREALRAHLGVSSDFLCLPFGEGNDSVVARLRTLGVRACFWSARPGRSTNRVGDDLGSIVRIKNDFLWRLPGRGRRSLKRIYADKIVRRLRGEAPY